MEQTFTLQNGSLLYADAGERFSLAPLLLAYFAAQRGEKRVLELCAGNGVASFWLRDRGLRGETVLVDTREQPLALARRTAAANGFEGVVALRADAAEFRGERLFDAVLCNPPFFAGGPGSPDADRDAARHENGLTPQKLCAAAARNLKQRGRFFLCHDPRRLADLVCALREARLEPKRMRLCRHEAGSAPFLLLLEAVYQGGAGLANEPDLLVRMADGRYSEEMLEVCERGYE